MPSDRKTKAEGMEAGHMPTAHLAPDHLRFPANLDQEAAQNISYHASEEVGQPGQISKPQHLVPAQGKGRAQPTIHHLTLQESPDLSPGTTIDISESLCLEDSRKQSATPTRCPETEVFTSSSGQGCHG